MPTTDKPVRARPEPSGEGDKKPGWWGRRSRWARGLLIAFTALCLLVFIGLVLLITVASNIPVPAAEANNQTTIVQFADGKTELGRFAGAENRVEVALSDIPLHVRDAVLAAEDRDFYSHDGVSFRALARAAINDVRGGARQGGSTISQQYAKNAFNDREKTFARKFREAVIATKLERKYSKDEILTLYLNEIYFGRGAYGIEAAARSYYNKPARLLTLEEGALLAGIIQSPSAYEPEKERGRIGAERRFRYVLDGMAKMKKFDATKVESTEFPMPTRKRSAGTQIKGPRSYILDAVRAEAARLLELEEEELYTGGYRIRTTIDPKAQAAAEKAIKDFFGKQPAGLQQAIVAVDPKTGAIRAMYAGRDTGDDKKVDYTGIVGGARRQPGSSFKPYVLAAALENGIGLATTYNGDSPSKPYPDKPEGFENFGGQDHGQVDLARATAKSVNTTYIELGQQVGIGKVADAAKRAGIRASIKFDESAVSTPLGVTDLPVVDQAVGFATFANGGERVTPYLVGNIFQNKKRQYEVKAKKVRAFDPKVAADVTFALQGVLAADGTAGKAALDGRPAAGKTGTTSDNKDTWFVGYTPQLSTAVWVGFDPPQELKNIQIAGEQVTALTGGQGPARVWKQFMDEALKGQPVVAFAPPANIGGSPSASPSATKSASPTVSASPTASSSPPASSSAAPSPTETASEAPPSEPPPSSEPPPPAETTAPPPEPTPEPPPEESPKPNETKGPEDKPSPGG